MSSVNKAIILGNLGHDPSVKEVASGDKVCTLNVATTKTYKDKSGAKQSKTTWHRVILWGNLGEVASKYLKKGSPVYIEGEIDNREYEDRDGVKKRISEIRATSLQLIGPKPQGESQAEDVPTSAPDDSGLPF
jgi:single-strand DNA-binding protein